MTVRTALAVLLVTSACEKNDLGKPCGTAGTPVPDPVGGEVPVVEVVRLERDSTCESFQCLTHRGLPPYCTQSCTLDPAPKAKTCAAATAASDCAADPFAGGTNPAECIDGTCRCTADLQCKDPLHCEDGACVDDDCPAGYWCKRPQEVGPLANQRYCVFKTGCRDNLQCEELGKMECDHLGCFDGCLRDYYTCVKPESTKCDDLECYSGCVRTGGTEYLCRVLPEACVAALCFPSCTPPPGAACAFHRLVCEPFDGLGCPAAGSSEACNDDPQTCPDKDLRCRPDASAPTWPPGALKKLNVCTPSG
ncbi:MAG: hypothetical protein HY903_25140 [Deltaproteobacteria bacterium]|nr:hypothetical protein [Deltaproteobacteria bacterium]